MRRDARERLVGELERVASELEGAPAKAVEVAASAGSVLARNAIELGTLRAQVTHAAAELRAIAGVHLTRTRGRR
jgi:hypothetical protein